MHHGFGPFGPHGPEGPHGPGGRRGGWFLQPPIWGFLQPCLLLILAEGPQHGYTLMEALNRRGLLDHEVDVGNLYRALRRMEHEGLVTSAWNTAEPGPNRRVYSLAPEGEALLQHWAGALEQRLRLLNHFLAEYHRVCGLPSPENTQRPPEDTTAR